MADFKQLSPLGHRDSNRDTANYLVLKITILSLVLAYSLKLAVKSYKETSYLHSVELRFSSYKSKYGCTEIQARHLMGEQTRVQTDILLELVITC